MVRRPNREELLAIRNGEKNLDDMIKWSVTEEKEIADLYSKSDLPEKVDMDMVRDMLLQMRRAFYASSDQEHLDNTIVYDNRYINAAIAS